MENHFAILKGANLRVTPVRSRVLEIFDTTEFALSNQEIEDALNTVDRVTLYRTLKSFEQKGIIHKVVDGTGQDKFAMCEHHCTEDHHHDEHIHFNCDQCGNTFCVDDVGIPNITLPKGYTVQSTNIVMKGVCDKCN